MKQDCRDDPLLPAYAIPAIKRAEKAEEVDEAAYFQANPDARASGMSAVQHFLSSGKAEGRLQYANLAEIAALREEKLKRLRFRRTPEGPRKYGEPLNFLTPQLISTFDIPEAPPVSANQYGGPFIDEVAANRERLCLDVGAGLRYTYSENIINLDIFSCHTTDVLCVGEDMPFESDQFDYVICAAVLEHTLRPWDVAREICRVLKPGGKVLIDYPFLQSVHGYPHHYFNATPRGAISLFEEHCTIISSTIEPNNHPIQSLWWVLKIWRSGLAQADQSRLDSLRIGDILARPLEQHLDEGYCANLSDWALHTIPAGSTLVAQKKTLVETDTSHASDTTQVSMNGAGLLAQQALSQRLCALESEILALRKSRSWRLMAPLRALSETWSRLTK